MPDTLDLDRLAALVDRLEALGLAPPTIAAAAINPDGTPGLVAPDELIESTWGNAVANSFTNVKIPNAINVAAAGSSWSNDLLGKLSMLASEQGVTVSAGDGTVTFPGAPQPVFATRPVVIATNINPTALGIIIGVYSVTTTNFRFRAVQSDGTNATGTVGIAWVAIGRRA